MSGEFRVGDRVQSLYGLEHVGTIVEQGQFPSGRTYWNVCRDLDGFVWIGWVGTMLPAATMN